MGPVIIFDKSTIQSLSAGEAQWLTHMYFSNITPVLFLEIVADLKKMSSNDRTPEQWVSGLAKKFSPINSLVNVYHVDMFMAELMFGVTPEMKGKIILGGGRSVTDTTGKRGMFYEEQHEHEALRRWKKGNFEEFERLLAENWRASLDQVDLQSFARDLRASLTRVDKLDLPEAVAIADRVCGGERGTRHSSLRAAALYLRVPDHLFQIVLKRWKAAGGPPVTEFAPFAAWCLRVNIIADLAIAYRLVSKPMEAKNRIDLQYLYYPPFCDVFSSHDRFHKSLVPLLLRKDQTFVAGEELKQDLAKINLHFEGISDEVNATGRVNYAGYPPRIPELLAYQLWDKHIGRGWQEHAEHPIEITPENSARIMEQLGPMIDAIERQTGKR